MTSERCGASARLQLLLLAFAALGGLGCSQRRPGIEVEVSMLHHMGSEPPFDAVHNATRVERGIVTDRGYGVTISRMQLVIGRLELVPCESTATARSVRLPRWGEVWRALSPVSVAHAHGLDSPLAINAPQVVDLMGADRESFAYGTLRPPPDRYCALEVHVEPADADADGLVGAPDLLGRSLYLQGSFIDREASVARPIALDLTLGDRVQVPFVDEAGAPIALKLSEHSSSAEVRLELSYGRLLDGIELRHTALEEQQHLVLHNLLEGLRAVVAD